MKLDSDHGDKVKKMHIEMCSDTHTRSGTAHIKMCSDVNNRMVSSQIKVFSDVLTKAGTPHKYTGRWGHCTYFVSLNLFVSFPLGYVPQTGPFLLHVSVLPFLLALLLL